MPDRDRDRSVEHLLRRVMSANAPAAQDACLDGETIAAWSEGSLHGAEASAVERHVAGCARCRALTSTLVRSTPPAPVAPSLWRRCRLGWLVPLATAATAAALWVALPNNGAVPPVPAEETLTFARDERDTTPPSATRDASKLEAEQPAPAAPTPRLQEVAKIAESNNETRQREDAVANRELLDRPNQPAAAAAPAAPPPAPAVPSTPRAGLSAAGERADANLRKEAASSSLAPTTAARRAFTPDQIVAPGGATRWRIVNARQVEHSTDAGAQWTPAVIEAAEPLNAGAAPSATICWIVGARGAVYLTTDGSRFMPLPFPEMLDLTSVVATDGLTATVSSANGRSWRTSNGGRSWETIGTANQ